MSKDYKQFRKVEFGIRKEEAKENQVSKRS